MDRTAGVIRVRDFKTGPRVVPLTRAVKSVLDGIEKTGLEERDREPAVRTTSHSHWNVIPEQAGLDDGGDKCSGRPGHSRGKC